MQKEKCDIITVLEQTENLITIYAPQVFMTYQPEEAKSSIFTTL